MKDTFERTIDYLRISVTDRCNFRCLYCMPDGIHKLPKTDIISDEDIITLVKQAVPLGFKKIRITGGEPLVRKGIYSLIKKIHNVEGVEEVVLTTNGSLLLHHVKQLKEAGVSRINLSIDSLQPEKTKEISNTTSTVDYIALIKELQEHNFTNTKVNVVLLKGINDDEIIDFYHFSQKYDVLVRFIELMPFEVHDFNFEDFYISKQEILKKHKEFIFDKRENNVDYYKTTENDTLIGFINAVSSTFCESCNRLRLTSDGYLKPCLHSDSEIYVKGLPQDKVIEKLRQAIHDKPKQHTLDKEYKNASKKSMNKIGG